MSYHPRIESEDFANFLTSRCRNSELWFVNNERLSNAILGYLAKYKDRYGVKIYAFSIQGNHLHTSASFPKSNRADFMRDFNSSVARGVPRYVKEFLGGNLFARRYSAEFTRGDDDVKEYFFYTVLQPVQDGLVEDIRDYPGYNCFWDVVNEHSRIFEVVDWARYNAEKRWKKNINVRDYTYDVILKYDRLPGYEDLSKREYKKRLMSELKHRQAEIKERRLSEGKSSVAGIGYIQSVVPGSRPHKTKISTYDTHRPRILSVCHKRRAKYKAWYFSIYYEYKEASKLYRAGALDTVFPLGTYPPPGVCVR